MGQPAHQNPHLTPGELAAWLATAAHDLPGLTAILVSPEATEVIFTGPARTRELALVCQKVLTEAQRRFAPEGQPAILGGFQDRGLEALEGYLRVDLA